MPLWKKKKAAEPAAPLDVLRWKIVAGEHPVCRHGGGYPLFRGRPAGKERPGRRSIGWPSPPSVPPWNSRSWRHRPSTIRQSTAARWKTAWCPPYSRREPPSRIPTCRAMMPHRCSLSANQCWKRRGKAWMGRTACGPKRLSGRHTPCGTGVPSGLRNTVQSPRPVGIGIEMYLFQDAATFRQEWGRMQLLYVAVAAGGVLALGRWPLR